MRVRASEVCDCFEGYSIYPEQQLSYYLMLSKASEAVGITAGT